MEYRPAESAAPQPEFSQQGQRGLAIDCGTRQHVETEPLLVRQPPSTGDLWTAPYLLQIIVLCYTRLMEPIAFFCIFPYIAEMVQRTGHLPDSDIGLYSGLMESAFSVTQTIFLFFWGSLAERVGRKPVLVLSLVGMSLGQILFGLSSTLWEMLLFRCLTGIFSSANLIIRTMIGELCTPDTQPQAFSWYSTSGNIALFLGPVLGGLLVDPTTQYPGLFKGITLFDEFPYAMPGLLIGAIGISAAVVAALCLKETLPTEAMAARNTVDDASSSRPTVYQLIKAPNVLSALVAYAHVAFMAFAYVAILPVMLYTTVELGGFGYSTSDSAVFIAFQGLSETIWLLFGFTCFQKRVGSLGVVRICAVAFPCVFGMHILLNGLLREGGGAAVFLSQCTTLALEFITPGIWMAFTAAQLRMNEVSPSQHALGNINSMAELVSSVLRSLSPPVFSALFAIGVREQILHGYLAWVILIALSMPLLVVWQSFMRDRTF